jgi:hypothetical protein
VDPNDNFFITGGGIGFFYNPYEIAPYSSGSTEIFLPWEEILPLLKKESAVTPLLLR